MVSGKTIDEFRVSEHCHIKGGKRVKAAFLTWYTKTEKAKGRRPLIKELIAEMRRKGSPLSGMVHKGQKEAADTYWRTMAQYYLRHVQVVRVNVATREVLTDPVCAYVALEKKRHEAFGEGGYVPLGRDMGPSERRSVVEQARVDFEAWLARFERYSDFLNVFRPVVKAYRKLQKDLE